MQWETIFKNTILARVFISCILLVNIVLNIFLCFILDGFFIIGSMHSCIRSKLARSHFSSLKQMKTISTQRRDFLEIGLWIWSKPVVWPEGDRDDPFDAIRTGSCASHYTDTVATLHTFLTDSTQHALHLQKACVHQINTDSMMLSEERPAVVGFWTFVVTIIYYAPHCWKLHFGCWEKHT